MKPMGIFGGTFDPIHYGHLRSAFEMLQALEFDEVRFIPCGDPPHRGVTFADAKRRMRLVELAVESQDGFRADDRELQRSGPSWTIDTLIELREEFPDRSLGLIVGMDAFLGLPSWHRTHLPSRIGWIVFGQPIVGSLLVLYFAVAIYLVAALALGDAP